MPVGPTKDDSASGAYVAMRRDRDSHQRNCEYWKKRAHEKMDKSHADGFTMGICVASGVWFVIAALFAIMLW